MENAIEQIIAVIEPWQSQRESMRQRCAAWLRSPSFATVFYDDAHPPSAVRVAIEHSGNAEAARVWEGLQVLGVQSPDLWGQYQGLATHGQVVFAHGIIVNPQFTTQPNRNLPCLVVASEDQSSAGIGCAGLMAVAVAELYATGTGTEDHPKIDALVHDDVF